MRIRKEYEPQMINWFLVPDLLKEIEKNIPASERTDGNYELLALNRFEISTFSQQVEMESDTDFLDFLNTTSETPLEVAARLACFTKWHSSVPSDAGRSYLTFRSTSERLHVEIARATTKSALSFLEKFEKTLQLKPAKPPLQDHQQTDPETTTLERTVFIAHSFDEIGRSYAYQLTKFLSLLGFEIATGEGFSPERVSSKVKRRLSAQEIVIAVLSERHDFTWLIQEMTGASFIEKPLFVLVEEQVDFKSGVLGDLEYVRFPKGCLAECFTSMLEGFRELGFEFS